jgi:glutaconyl-CoA/methylmalonyl-CoA decarboxylase subunit gamma
MIKKLRVTVDGKAFDVTVEIPDEPNGRPVVAPAPAAPAAPVQAAPQAAPAPSAPARAAAPGDIPSPLSGRVTAVIASPGQAVKEGEHIITLEAMKMNTFVFAPAAGTISKILVAVGDTVDEGQALASME